MDTKDFRLLVALDEDARRSFRALGRKVSLSAPAVRDRLQHLEERGILQGYWVSINPAIFGRKDVLVSFGSEWSHGDAVTALGGPDVAWVARKADGGLTVELWPHDVKRGIAALVRFLGRDPRWHGVGSSAWSGALSKLDWKVLDALVDVPRASVEQLTHATRLSPKTVRKHVTHLTKSEAIYVVPRLGFLADAGDVVFHLSVIGDVSFAELRRVIGDVELVHETDNPTARWLFCRVRGLGELAETEHALGRLRGVVSVQLSLNREMLIGTDFVHVLVRERLTES